MPPNQASYPRYTVELSGHVEGEQVGVLAHADTGEIRHPHPSQFLHDLLRIMRERENVCKYLNIALQHISDPILKRMRRPITKQETYELIDRIREEVPGIHLRTTLMVGYPGETNEDPCLKTFSTSCYTANPHQMTRSP